jgi:hypothetical protein
MCDKPIIKVMGFFISDNFLNDYIYQIWLMEKHTV